MPRLAAALLLLASLATARAAPAAAWPFALTDDVNCPAMPAITVQAFVEGTGKRWRSDWEAALNKGSAANLACHLNLLLARRDAGNATASGLLAAMYQAWRAVHSPQRWHPAAASQANWLASLRYIASVNTLMSNKWWAGLNSYSDLSAGEFAATVLQTAAQAGVQQAAAGSTKGARKLLARYLPPTATYPLTINCATAGRVLPQVSFQGQCASSWAFAAAAALESKLMIGAGTSTTPALSAQHLMDCAASLANYTAPPCNGGSPADAFAFAATTGVATDDAYPYRGLNGNSANAPGRPNQCDRSFLAGQAAKQGTARITGTPAFAAVTPSKLGLITALAAQPLVASIGVDASFQHYAGGIWSSPDCNVAQPSQVLLVVGYDVSRAGQEQFVAKNSLGAAWGEAGSIRIAMSDTPAGTCGLYLRALQPGAVTTLAATKPGNGKV